MIHYISQHEALTNRLPEMMMPIGWNEFYTKLLTLNGTQNLQNQHTSGHTSAHLVILCFLLRKFSNDAFGYFNIN